MMMRANSRISRRIHLGMGVGLLLVCIITVSYDLLCANELPALRFLFYGLTSNLNIMSEIIITTTSSISGVEIEKYLGLVTTNLVIGTNVFSDFLASFSDFFGGMSGTYRNQLDLLYKRALDDLTNKANKKRADAILGVKIDFDEISGQGKSMFMVSITGTAVRFKNKVVDVDSRGISKEQLQLAIFKNNWKSKPVEEPVTQEEWDMILGNNLIEFGPSLYKRYLSAWQREGDRTTDNFPQFLLSIGYNDAVEIIYEEYAQRYSYADGLISKLNLFSPSHILELILNGNHTLAVRLLKFDKSRYALEDVVQMRKILTLYDNLPDNGKIESVKSGLLSSKMVDKYICSCGHISPIDIDFCPSCNLNKKGLLSWQAKEVEKFREKVEVLEQIIK
ncbi:MAG: YbjQ family protein [Rikenellaceae bacterium]|nr:YbjQ family protein [Rikenellaceae bacterium]